METPTVCYRFRYLIFWYKHQKEMKKELQKKPACSRKAATWTWRHKRQEEFRGERRSQEHLLFLSATQLALTKMENVRVGLGQGNNGRRYRIHPSIDSCILCNQSKEEMFQSG